MHPPYTLISQTRQRILLAYSDALRAWANGENIDAVELRCHVDNILRDALEQVQRAVAHKSSLEADYRF